MYILVAKLLGSTWARAKRVDTVLSIRSMYVCMYVCSFGWLARMFAYQTGGMYILVPRGPGFQVDFCLEPPMYVCMYVCMYVVVHMYVCM